MAQVFANNAATVLNGAVAAEDTVLIVAHAAGFPEPTAGDFFLATLIGYDSNGNENAWEIVKCTERDGNSLTVQRSQEGSTARAWADATRVELRMTAGTLNNLAAVIVPDLSSVQSKPGDVLSTYSPERVPPEWVLADGADYERGIYPALDELWPVWVSEAATTPGAYTNVATCLAGSADLSYTAIGFSSAPYLKVYKRDDNSYSMLPDLAVLPPSQPASVSFSDGGDILALSTSTSSGLQVYERTGDTFTVVPVNGLTSSKGTLAAVSPDGNYIAYVFQGTPYINIFKRVSGEFVLLDSTGLTLSNYGNSRILFHPSGNYLCASINNTLHVIQREGDVFTNVKTISLPVLTTSLAFDSAGELLAIGHSNTPYLQVLNWNNADPVAIPVSSTIAVAVKSAMFHSPTGYLVVIGGGVNDKWVFELINGSFEILPGAKFPSPSSLSNRFAAVIDEAGKYLVQVGTTASTSFVGQAFFHRMRVPSISQSIPTKIYTGVSAE